MIEWIPTPESSRTDAIAYLPEEDSILVRFPDGAEWRYDSCPANVWEEFAYPVTSKGAYIREQLDQHPNGPFAS
ncbi:MAG: hypothetical protein DHS20C19_00210 [Acidimicrobiales bacterium]|nr:MAG: hypothetical protein DHS20C19_00210 [Acidimicrobiales bacterium]